MDPQMNPPAKEEPPIDKAWAMIHELAGLKGPPNNREERRRVEKVLAKLKKRGLTVM